MTQHRWLGILLLTLVSGALLSAWSMGLFNELTAERLEQLFRDAGIWGPLLYVALFAALESFGVPGILFIVPASIVWNWPTLFLLTWAGAVGASVVGFSFSRTIGRSWVQGRLSERARLYDDAIAKRGLRTVILIRLMFFIAPWAHWLLGLTKVRFRDYVVGTAIGLAPMMALFTWGGATLVDYASDNPLLGALLFLALMAAMGLAGRQFQAQIEVQPPEQGS